MNLVFIHSIDHNNKKRCFIELENVVPNNRLEIILYTAEQREVTLYNTGILFKDPGP